MMHHPNMHHQPMSGHPPQHLPGHQTMPAHHQIPPHQMHRENRHVTLTRVPLGPSQAGGAMGAHGHGHGQLGGLGALGVPHHAPAPRPPHAIRPMHHPPAQHHSVPPPSRPMRRPYSVGGAYAAAGAGVMPPYAPPPAPPPAPQHRAKPAPHLNTRGIRPLLSKLKPSPGLAVSSAPAVSASAPSSVTPAVVEKKADEKPVADAAAGVGVAMGAGAGVGVSTGMGAGAAGDAGARGEEDAGAGDEAPRPLPAPANSKEKTPMCLVNELARYNKIKHQYRLTSETGPAHKKVFTVTLRLGDTEEYTAEGSSIKRAQHAAAAAALGGTRFPAPPPRAAPPHQPPHARHATAVMPTVELNALAMKLCQPALYTAVPAAPAPRRPRAPPYRLPLLPPHYPPPHPPHHPPPHAHPPHPRIVDTTPMIYRVRVSVGGRSWVGEGSTPQAARHDAAARALLELRAPPSPPAADALHDAHDNENGEGGTDLLNSEVKSPVSLVHELALKRNLSVQFTVKSERGPPHMRVFVTVCSVGEMETEGQGNGKKVSKRRAAERMLAEMRARWPPAALRARPPDRRRPHQPKKKPRNLIKEGGAGSPCGGAAGGGAAGAGGAAGDNPISRLAVARHAARARSPQYRVLEERGAARRREFLVQCDAPPHCATGLGPNKKTAKRRAAHNVLLAMEMSAGGDGAAAGGGDAACGADPAKNNSADIKRKDNETGGLGNDIRQPVPGVLVMDYHQRAGQPPPPNGVSETSATGGTGVLAGVGGLTAGGLASTAGGLTAATGGLTAGPGGLTGGPGGLTAGTGGLSAGTGAQGGGNSPGAKDQLMYLSQLLGFTVQFSDFPKRNHGEYLSLVSLSTEPPVMCHGGGASTALSHEQCARAALRALALMGLDAPAAPAAGATPPGIGISTLPSATAKTNIITNGIAE